MDEPAKKVESSTVDPDAFVEHIAREFDGVKINGAVLADLFSLCGAGGSLAKPLRFALQKSLLKRTIAEATAHCQYYAKRPVYGKWLDTPSSQSPNLTCWPVLHRNEVVENLDHFIADNVTLRSICHTSGTTGTALDVHKSVEEVNFLQEYYGQVFKPYLKMLKERPLILSFPNHYHGVPVPMPVVGKVFVSGVTDDTLIQDAHKVLGGRYRISGHNDRITVISGLAFHVMFFTSYLIEQGVNPRSFGLTSINITGGYQSPHWRRFLAESWGCHVNDRLTLTEAIGGAYRGPDGRTFYLDPHIIGEVLDPVNHEPLSEGIGLLTLTNLHPFVQMQPLIRYSTGDLVRIVDAPDSDKGLSFDFLGKYKNCVSWHRNGVDHWLLFSARLNDLLGSIPDIRVYDWFSNVKVAKDRTIGSLPLHRVEFVREDQGRRARLAIHLELRYAPHCYPGRTHELRNIVINAMRQVEGTSVARLCDAQELDFDIEFHGPDSLNAAIEIKI